MSKRILVVEDQADNRQIIRDMLAPTDYEITEAENGVEALAAIAKQRPDLALNGEEKKARAAGCDDYVPKPFSPRQLLAKIRHQIAAAQRRSNVIFFDLPGVTLTGKLPWSGGNSSQFLVVLPPCGR